ncbi:MAG: ABC transporter permease [Bacteroidales bacterium]|nr:ABC transporter permease [Bacteroidales bacterium]
MPLVKSISTLGSYVTLMGKVFSIPDKWSVFFKQTVKEIWKLIFDSIWIVVIISVFIGAVITIQMQLNMASPLFPRYTVGLATRDTLLLEFSSAIMCLILAGKVGSNIASEIGTMRVTEQIDALDIMGVNSANYLILPKIVALVAFIPLLVILSMSTGILGGYFVALMTSMISVDTYVYGIQTMFVPYYVFYSIYKSFVFAFIIASISSYYGYTVKGGALEVGKASTNAVVISSVIILLFDVILTKLLLQ